MAEQFETLQPEHIAFIARQKLFFVATAAPTGHVNVSPKGPNSVAVTAPDRVLWLNLTGSGNETAAHLAKSNRMTLMWCAFEGPPRILRVYGSAQVVHPRDAAWADCAKVLPPPPGTRQYLDLTVSLVQTSCGYGVPEFEYVAERTALQRWTDHKGPDGIEAYWREKNTRSIDGFPTGIVEP
jgi:hypothetical protein